MVESIDDIIKSLTIELKRGTLVLSVLSQLRDTEYGYSLVQKLEGKNAAIDPSTLYPLLRRLEKQKLLKAEWDTTSNRPRKYYSLSEEGKKVYLQLKKEWRLMVSQVENLLMEDNNNESN